MPKEVTTTVYSFEELVQLGKDGKVKPGAVEKARQWLHDCNVGDDHWSEYLLELWTNALDQIGFTDAKISFSGFWSQGDGASFTSSVDVPRLIDFLTAGIKPNECINGANPPIYGHDEDFRPWIVSNIGSVASGNFKNYMEFRRLLKAVDYIDCSVDRTSHHYSHPNTCRFNADFRLEEKYPRLEKLANDFRAATEAIRMALCYSIYNELEKEYYYQTSDEALKETAEANEYTFTIDGKRWG